MTVETLITNYKQEFREGLEFGADIVFTFSAAVLGAMSDAGFVSDAWYPPGQSFDEIMDGVAFSALKYLANDGFIKLSDAEMFENREILQFHATAQPEFRSGKFQL